jgi:hypothetical protein
LLSAVCCPSNLRGGELAPGMAVGKECIDTAMTICLGMPPEAVPNDMLVGQYTTQCDSQGQCVTRGCYVKRVSWSAVLQELHLSSQGNDPGQQDQPGGTDTC